MKLRKIMACLLAVAMIASLASVASAAKFTLGGEKIEMTGDIEKGWEIRADKWVDGIEAIFTGTLTTGQRIDQGGFIYFNDVAINNIVTLNALSIFGTNDPTTVAGRIENFTVNNNNGFSVRGGTTTWNGDDWGPQAAYNTMATNVAVWSRWTDQSVNLIDDLQTMTAAGPGFTVDTTAAIAPGPAGGNVDATFAPGGVLYVGRVASGRNALAFGLMSNLRISLVLHIDESERDDWNELLKKLDKGDEIEGINVFTAAQLYTGDVRATDGVTAHANADSLFSFDATLNLSSHKNLIAEGDVPHPLPLMKAFTDAEMRAIVAEARKGAVMTITARTWGEGIHNSVTRARYTRIFGRDNELQARTGLREGGVSYIAIDIDSQTLLHDDFDWNLDTVWFQRAVGFNAEGTFDWQNAGGDSSWAWGIWGYDIEITPGEAAGSWTTANALKVLRASVGAVTLTDSEKSLFAIAGDAKASDALRILKVAAGA